MSFIEVYLNCRNCLTNEWGAHLSNLSNHANQLIIEAVCVYAITKFFQNRK